MKESNTKLFKRAKRAIDDVFRDTRVPRVKTKAQLKELFADIEGILDSLDDVETE